MSGRSPDIEEIVYLFAGHAPNCAISTDLINQMATFPVTETCFSPSIVTNLTRSSVCYKFLPIFSNLIEKIVSFAGSTHQRL